MVREVKWPPVSCGLPGGDRMHSVLPWKTHARPARRRPGDQATTPIRDTTRPDKATTAARRHSLSTYLGTQYCVALLFIYPRHLHAPAGRTSPVGA